MPGPPALDFVLGGGINTGLVLKALGPGLLCAESGCSLRSAGATPGAWGWGPLALRPAAWHSFRTGKALEGLGLSPAPNRVCPPSLWCGPSKFWGRRPAEGQSAVSVEPHDTAPGVPSPRGQRPKPHAPPTDAPGPSGSPVSRPRPPGPRRWAGPASPSPQPPSGLAKKDLVRTTSTFILHCPLCPIKDQCHLTPVWVRLTHADPAVLKAFPHIPQGEKWQITRSLTCRPKSDLRVPRRGAAGRGRRPSSQSTASEGRI